MEIFSRLSKLHFSLYLKGNLDSNKNTIKVAHMIYSINLVKQL